MEYLLENLSRIFELLLQHVILTIQVLVPATLVAVPLGLLIKRKAFLEEPILGLFSLIYTIPSLSFFVILIPIFGLGRLNAVFTLIAYAQVVLVRNWVIGLKSIDLAILESADGMGMNKWQRFKQIEFPLALPYLLAGVSLATINTIAIGTIAAFINAGGLGVILFEGVITANHQKIIAGSLAVSLLAFLLNYLLRKVESHSEKRIFN